jgi:hypothetical protein
MGRRFSSLSGFVLAGGESRRMGQPKPLLALAGETMLEHQVRLLRSICRSVAVIGLLDGLTSADVPIIPDIIQRRGPLGGIFSGLLRTRTEFNLFLGCDLPFVPARPAMRRRRHDGGDAHRRRPAPLRRVPSRCSADGSRQSRRGPEQGPIPGSPPAPGFHRAFLLTSTRRRITTRRNES